MSLVKSVFRGEDGHEEAIHGAIDCCDIEGRGSRYSGEGDLPQAQHIGCDILHLAQEVPGDGDGGYPAAKAA